MPASVALLLVLAVPTAGCGSGTDEEGTVNGPTSSSDAATGASAPVVRQALADLSRRLDVPVGQITVVSLEEVTWPNGALGCPQPGMSYTMALVDGHRVVLEAEGERYRYHAGGSREAFLCTDPDQVGHSGG